MKLITNAFATGDVVLAHRGALWRGDAGAAAAVRHRLEPRPAAGLQGSAGLHRGRGAQALHPPPGRGRREEFTQGPHLFQPVCLLLLHVYKNHNFDPSGWTCHHIPVKKLCQTSWRRQWKKHVVLPWNNEWKHYKWHVTRDWNLCRDLMLTTFLYKYPELFKLEL